MSVERIVKKLRENRDISESNIRKRVVNPIDRLAYNTKTTEPFRDALRIHIESMKDSIEKLEEYCEGTPQSKMRATYIKKHLTDINLHLTMIRKDMEPNKYNIK